MNWPIISSSRLTLYSFTVIAVELLATWPVKANFGVMSAVFVEGSTLDESVLDAVSTVMRAELVMDKMTDVMLRSASIWSRG